MLTYAKFQVLTAVLLNRCVISTLYPDVSKDRSAVCFQGQAVQQQQQQQQQQPLFFTVWR
jgi:hypothetical protein